MQTDLQKCNRQLEDIILVAELDGDEHRTIRQQLESLSFMSIDVMHQIVTRIATLPQVEQQEFSFKRR